MFKILAALRDLSTTCDENDRHLRWSVVMELGRPVLRAEIALTDGDRQLVEDMQALFAPKEG